MYSIVDIEATGGNSNIGRLTEIAIYRFDGIEIVDKFSSLVNPEMKIPPYVQKLTGINNKMASAAPIFGDIADEVERITRDSCFVAHNVKFDYSFLQMEFAGIGKEFKRERLCTLQLSERLIPDAPAYGLGKLCDSLGISITDRHRADGDAQATVELFKHLMMVDSQLGKNKIHSLRRRA